MKYILLSIVLSFSVLSFDLKISNLSGSYSDPSGSAFVKYLNLKDEILVEKKNISIEKQGGSFFLRSNEKEMEISSLPELIVNMQKLNFKNINANISDSNFSLSFEQLGGSDQDNLIDLKQFSLSCDHKSNLDYLNSCFNVKGELKLQNGRLKSKKDTRFSRVTFYTNQNKMNFTLKTGSHFIKGYGASFYENGVIKIKVTKAKRGILNVTGMLFKELSKFESENIEVKRPWIKIHLN